MEVMQRKNLSKDFLLGLGNPAIKKTISNDITDTEAERLLYDWSIWARDKQLLPEGFWDVWLLLAGRGFGKTRTGAETIRIWKDNNPIIHLVGATAGDTRDIMVEGPAGIIPTSPAWDRPIYKPSLRRLEWPNGSIAIMFSADEPDRLRGPQCHKAWADELASWRYPEAWDMLQLGNRLGKHPQTIVTTTPRPTAIIRELISFETTHVTKGSTFENKKNLSDNFIRAILNRYEGTRLGRQEIYAEILDDVIGALWTTAMVEGHRVKEIPPLKRTVIAIDPATTKKKDSDETGIIVAGLGVDNRAYVFDDLSGQFSPNGWAMRVVGAYINHKADRVIAETNQGGDMVENTVRTIDPNVSYKGVHAKTGKYLRAEPVAALYEQGRVSHVGVLPALESQMTTWQPLVDTNSPDRVDALVYALTELMIEDNNGDFWVF